MRSTRLRTIPRRKPAVCLPLVAYVNPIRTTTAQIRNLHGARRARRSASSHVLGWEDFSPWSSSPAPRSASAGTCGGTASSEACPTPSPAGADGVGEPYGTAGRGSADPGIGAWAPAEPYESTPWGGCPPWGTPYWIPSYGEPEPGAAPYADVGDAGAPTSGVEACTGTPEAAPSPSCTGGVMSARTRCSPWPVLSSPRSSA